MPSVTVNGSLVARNHEKLSAMTTSTALTATNYHNDVTANGVFDRRRRAVEALITIETADVRWTMDGTTPTVTGGGSEAGHLASAGDAILLTGYAQIVNFRIINAVAANGAIARVSYLFKE